MYVDPEVVRLKVERELTEYLGLADYYRARGIWLLEYQFPKILFAIIAKNHKPYPLALFGILMDFENYDVDPPSVRFVDPMTKQYLQRSAVNAPFFRLRPDGQVDQLIQGWSPDDESPFLCLQGVREYHENPGHSGDSWLLHRALGAGRMAHILDVIARYGSDPITASQFQMQIVPTGQFAITPPTL